MNEYRQAIDILAFIQRHPGHASQKPHGRRYGASGEALAAGHKKKDVVTGGSKAAQGRVKGGGTGGSSKEAGFLKDDKGIKSHYNLTEKCKKQKAACEGISSYADDDKSVINNHLRGKATDRIGEVYGQVQKLDQAFEVMPRVPEDMKVARFVKGDIADMMQPGAVFKDKGFISTTINPDLAFEAYDGEADWKIHINVPKGSKGIYVAEKSNYAWEKELLLPRNSEMKVTGKDPATKTIYADYQ